MTWPKLIKNAMKMLTHLARNRFVLLCTKGTKYDEIIKIVRFPNSFNYEIAVI